MLLFSSQSLESTHNCLLRRQANGKRSWLGPLHTVPQTAFPRPRQGSFAPCTPSLSSVGYSVPQRRRVSNTHGNYSSVLNLHSASLFCRLRRQAEKGACEDPSRSGST